MVPIVAELRALLTFVREHNRSDAVVEWEGGDVQSVKAAVRASVTAAGLVYGRAAEDGVTFHTVRHSIATFLTTLPGVSERMRAEVMGQTIQTAQKYTHLSGQHQVGAHAELAASMPVGRAIVGGVFGGRAAAGSPPPGDAPVLLRRVPRRRTVATSVASPDRPDVKSSGKAGQDEEAAATPTRRRKSRQSK